MSDEKYKFAVARFKSMHQHPYLSTAFMALTLVDPEHLPPNVLGTMGVDKRWRLYASPDVWDKWTTDEQAAVLYHEVHHLLRMHFTRMELQTLEHPFLSNCAQDAEINDDLIAEGVKLPQFPPCPKCKCNGGPVTPALFKLPDGKMAEDYYVDLLKHRIDCACECHAGGGGDGFPNDGARPGAGSCGSAAGGKQRPWELPEDGGGKDMPQGVSEARGDLIRHDVAQKIRDAGKEAGNIPAGWRLWADSLLAPKVNWRKELAACIRRSLNDVAGAVDYTWRRPNRRDDGDVILPALRHPVPNPGFIWDTSGSMGGTENKVLAEVGGVVKAVANGVTVICCDTEVQSVGRIFNPRQVQIAGGGGTVLTPAIEHARAIRPKLDVLVIASDCYVYDGWGPAPRGMKVIVARIGGQGEPPPWPHHLIDVEIDE
jgi:predicted metal-dependent peptidase